MTHSDALSNLLVHLLFSNTVSENLDILLYCLGEDFNLHQSKHPTYVGLVMEVEVKEKARDGSGRKLEKSYVEEEHWE